MDGSIREKLHSLGVSTEPGQNFLVDETVIEALVKAGETEDRSVLEIGGGTGAVTSRLLEDAASVRTVENDPRLAEYLRNEFPGAEVVEQDFLELEEIEEERCVSNLPFQISSEALEKLGRLQVQSAVIVQDELAKKVVAEPGDPGYGHLSVICQYFFVPVKLRTVSSDSFYPEPEVNGAILKLYPNEERHGVESPDHMLEVSKALFTHKRKKVRNAFVDARHMLEMEKQRAKELRDELPHSEERVNNLDVRKLVEIASAVKEF